MLDLNQSLRGSVIPGLVAGLATFAMISWRGQKDTRSAVAPINATSHILWGDEAAANTHITLRHTLPGLLINAGATIGWSVIDQLMVRTLSRRKGALANMMGGVFTALLAYLVDYHLVPSRLTPGWEKRISNHSLYLSLGTMGLALGIGSYWAQQRSH